MESAIDVVALPGKFTDDGRSVVLNQLAQSLGKLVAYQHRIQHGLPLETVCGGWIPIMPYSRWPNHHMIFKRPWMTSPLKRKTS
jgi:hypothetical protein